MDTLSTLIERREPIAADSPCEAVLERFVRDPSALTLAVIDEQGPVGVIGRDAFLARMEVPGSGDLAARAVMSSPPVLMACDVPVDAALSRLLADCPEALLTGFVAVDGDGQYVGVCSAVNLLRGRASPGPAAGSGRLIERITAEAQGPVQNTLAAIERLRKFRLPTDAASCLDTIFEASSSVLTLLSIAADLQRAQTSELTFKPEPRRLNDLMDQIESRWRDRAVAVGVTLLVAYDGDPGCSALVDEARLIQVFDALIGHALANVRHGVVEASLRASVSDAGVQLHGGVRDNGALYAAGYLETLFDEATIGSGDLDVTLGLALASRTLGALGGALSAVANVGAGATIAFDVTVKSVDDVAEQVEEGTQPSGRSAHVLVVDDNATNRMVVEALCEMFDCSTESVADGLEAVEAARHGRFDVILMDIKMPRMDGVTATREIRKLKGGAGKAPIIALTANADPDEVREYLAAGMLCVVEKPIKPERLMEALDAALAAGESKSAEAAAA
jgi:CheY-like chemotaxis protein